MSVAAGVVWCEFSNIVVLLQAYRAVLSSSGSGCHAVVLLTSLQPNGKGGVHRVMDTVVIGGDQVSEVADGLARHIVPILERDTGRPHVSRSRMCEEGAGPVMPASRVRHYDSERERLPIDLAGLAAVMDGGRPPVRPPTVLVRPGVLTARICSA